MACKFQCQNAWAKGIKDFGQRRNLMLENRLLDALKNKFREKPYGEIAQATAKIENQKRLSTKEFQRVYEIIWQEGPAIKYQNPGARERELQTDSNIPNL
jgi:hypothetical protein